MRNPKAVILDPNTISSCPGDIVHCLYSPQLMKDGTVKLVKSGEVNIQDSINSFAPATDLNIIAHRLALGDTSVLRSDVPFYGDVTDAPKTMAETLQLVIDGQKQFDSLPLSVRQSFDNDFYKWFSSAGSESWLDLMGFKKSTSAVDSDVDQPPMSPDPDGSH